MKSPYLNVNSSDFDEIRYINLELGGAKSRNPIFDPLSKRSPSVTVGNKFMIKI